MFKEIEESKLAKTSHYGMQSLCEMNMYKSYKIMHHYEIYHSTVIDPVLIISFILQMLDNIHYRVFQ